MFLLCLKWLMSYFLPLSLAVMLCLTSFLSYFIFISLMRNSFYFSFKISIFLSSSNRFCSYSKSMERIFSCHNFSFSLLYSYKMPIYYYSAFIIYEVTLLFTDFFDFNFYLPALTFCSRSLNFYCFTIYC